MINVRMRYTRSPGNAAEKIDPTTYRTRTRVGSQSSHSASPPHTPVTMELVVDRRSGFCKLFDIRHPPSRPHGTPAMRCDDRHDWSTGRTGIDRGIPIIVAPRARRMSGHSQCNPHIGIPPPLAIEGLQRGLGRAYEGAHEAPIYLGGNSFHVDSGLGQKRFCVVEPVDPGRLDRCSDEADLA